MVQDTETLTDTFANIGGTYRAWIMANPERQVVSTTAAVDGAILDYYLPAHNMQLQIGQIKELPDERSAPRKMDKTGN